MNSTCTRGITGGYEESALPVQAGSVQTTPCYSRLSLPLCAEALGCVRCTYAWLSDSFFRCLGPLAENPACAKAPGCGPWERPEKLNPDYKGKWYPRMIPNPEYVGEWAPKQIPNPDYYLDETPLANIGKIGAAAVEIWTMSAGIVFDNFLATYDEEVRSASPQSLKTLRAPSCRNQSRPLSDNW